MRILLVFATDLEAKNIVRCFSFEKKIDNHLSIYRYKNTYIDVLIAGVGMVNTTFHLTKILLKKEYDYCINLGIAGSFNQQLAIGEVVEVKKDLFADIGIETADDFKTLFEANLADSSLHPFSEGHIKSNYIFSKDIQLVEGLTVSKGSGNNFTISVLGNKFDADVETMEGAAFFFVTNMLQVRGSQIRGISNYVTTRDTTQWNINLALKNLSNKFIKQLDSLILQNH